MRIGFVAKIVCSEIANRPLRTISERHSRCLSKIVAAIAIAVFTICSLGFYAIHAVRYFANKKWIAMDQRFENAVKSNDVEQVKELIRKMPSLKKAINGSHGRTPCLLHLAVDKKHTGMIDTLISFGADLHAMSRMGTPLAVAVQRGHLDMAALLLEKNADPNLGDDGRSPIYLAVTELKGTVRLEMIKLLLERNASPNKESGFSPLRLVAGLWETNPDQTREAMELLLKKGAHLNDNDSRDLHPEALKLIQEHNETIV